MPRTISVEVKSKDIEQHTKEVAWFKAEKELLFVLFYIFLETKWESKNIGYCRFTIAELLKMLKYSNKKASQMKKVKYCLTILRQNGVIYVETQNDNFTALDFISSNFTSKDLIMIKIDKDFLNQGKKEKRDTVVIEYDAIKRLIYMKNELDGMENNIANAINIYFLIQCSMNNGAGECAISRIKTTLNLGEKAISACLNLLESKGLLNRILSSTRYENSCAQKYIYYERIMSASSPATENG